MGETGLVGVGGGGRWSLLLMGVVPHSDHNQTLFMLIYFSMLI